MTSVSYHPSQNFSTLLTSLKLEEGKLFKYCSTTTSYAVQLAYGTALNKMASQNIPKMSLVAQFDDLCRYTKVLTTGCEKDFIEFVESQLNLLHRLKQAEVEIQEIKNRNNTLETEKKKYECHMKHMKNLVEDEVKKKKELEKEKISMERRIVLIKEVLLADGKAIDNQTKERLFLLSNTTCRPQLDSQTKLTTIEESIESLISPSDIDDTDEDLNPNISRRRKRRSKGNKRSSGDRIEKRKKSEESEAFRREETEDEFRMDLENMPEKNTSEFRSNSEPNSTSLVDPPPQAHHSDSGQIKSPTYDIRIHNTGTLSSNKPHGRYSTGGKLSRIHAFVTKTVIRTEKCYPCGNMIKFCKQALKCTDCRITCHPECKDRCPLPCIPVTFTPTKGPMGTIGDYTSSTPPMIPSLIVHCVNEIESRGLKEIGLYRISGSERDVKDLNQKLLKGRSAISLNKVDIHAVCGTIKEFLRSLKEPLVTRAAWQTFVDAAEQKEETMSLNLLYEAVCELPQPNKETLAFLILHFQRVAEAYECRMPLENLAKVFGPTIVGYSSAEPADSRMLTETKQQCQVMQKLLMLPADTWQNILNVESSEVFNVPQLKTPDLTPAPVVSRLGPIYASQASARVGRTPLTPRNVKYSTRSGKRFFESPLK
ncbi:rac GTPase-activating protein 1 [Trichonephila inaurata madagascariensis]|uniref:Rac GTPase-activating protein 1 n=1 Tax=Trichonephila inaurata madagascariensis TaxID=2747483 RepID=A0A8X7BXI1_9ARAC|nr:rac GTPase-activating protein 1 [Trichonephila inaurata madagascariensis]